MNRVLAGACLLVSLFCQSVFAIERVSESEFGVASDRESFSPVVSGNERYVAFSSFAENLVDEVLRSDKKYIFIKDLQTKKIEVISLTPSGELFTTNSHSPAISYSGRYVAFVSRHNDGNGLKDFIFVQDRVTASIERISHPIQDDIDTTNFIDHVTISANGRFIAYNSFNENNTYRTKNNGVFIYDRETKQNERISTYAIEPSISANGLYITFVGSVYVNGIRINQVQVQNLQTKEITRVSSSELGVLGNNHSSSPSISSNGRFIAFASNADNLVLPDVNQNTDIFVKDTVTGAINMVSISSSGEQGPRASLRPSISANGQYVTFDSSNRELVYGKPYVVIDVFVHDTKTGLTKLVSKTFNGGFSRSRSDFSNISSQGGKIVFTSRALNLIENNSGLARDAFVSDNPIKNSINLVGAPDVDNTSESGIYIWKNSVGRTFVKVVAGEQNGEVSNFSGSIVSDDLISSINSISLELSKSDRLNQINSLRLDFNLFVANPDKDVFSFVSDQSSSLCLLLSKFKGGMFLGPQKVEVSPPYDINNQATCDARTVPWVGAPDVDKNKDHGIFIWEVANNVFKVSVVSANGFSLVDINIDSDHQLSNFVTLGLETNDTVNLSAYEISLNLRVASGAKDGFKFKALDSLKTCFKTSSTLPIYVGPLRAQLGSSVNLDTLKPCN